MAYKGWLVEISKNLGTETREILKKIKGLLHFKGKFKGFLYLMQKKQETSLFFVKK